MDINDERYVTCSSKPPDCLCYKYVKSKCDECGADIYIRKENKNIKKFCYMCGLV